MELEVGVTCLREGTLLDMVRMCFDLKARGVKDAGVCFVGASQQDIIDGYERITEEFKLPCSKMSELASLLARTEVKWGVTWIDQDSKSQVMETMIGIAEKVYNPKNFSLATIIHGKPSCKLELAP